MESDLHGLFKSVVQDELTEEGYNLYIEPSESPLKRLRWDYYRPDIFGLICHGEDLRLIIVECEATPSAKRVNQKLSKIKWQMSLQKKLNERHVLRLLLIIPPGSLRKVNHTLVRRFWEIWIVSNKGRIVHKLPKKQFSD